MSSKKPIDDFAAAAEKTLQDNSPAGQQQAQTEHEKKYAAQEAQMLDLYNNSIAPIVKAISRLPEKDGKKFKCRVLIKNDHDDMPKMSVDIGYQVSPKQVETISFVASMEYNTPLSTPVFCFGVDPTQKNRFPTLRKAMNSEGFSTAAKLLGEWVAKVAPDRLDDLKQELANTAPEPDKVKFKRPEESAPPPAPAAEQKKRGFLDRFKK